MSKRMHPVEMISSKKRNAVYSMLIVFGLIVCTLFFCGNLYNAVSAKAESIGIPTAVIDPALVGTWGFHDKDSGVDIVWVLNEDGTGSTYINGMSMPIASYIVTKDLYTDDASNGYLLKIYYGSVSETYGTETHTFSIPEPIEKGYLLLDQDTLYMVHSRDFLNYDIFTRK